MKALADLGKVYLPLCEEVNSPRSLACFLLFKYGEYEQLVNLDFDPLQYRDARESIEKVRNDYLVTEMLSKYKAFPIDVDKGAVAIADFKEAEKQCRSTNQRIKRGREFGFPPNVEQVLYHARRKISKLLYDVGRPFELSILFDESQFGPGATYDLPRKSAYIDNKVGNLSISPRALKYLNLDLGTSQVWNEYLKSRKVDNIDYNGCNKVTTVPKNAKKDRTIGIEPAYSMFFQKSIGNWLRSQLEFVSVFLKDQSRNQELARIASILQNIATIDLKNASGSICIELIYELFPVDFACILDDLRSPSYELDDAVHRYEQFSSMGNGFTFEVESVIFWALTTACRDVLGAKERRFAIYGDDIIVSSECVPLLEEVFSYCGFSFNKKKTHSTGSFRESCGKHYYMGSDITPIYQKESIDVLEECYRLANRVRRLAVNRMAGAGSDGVLRRSWIASVRLVRALERERELSFEVPLNSELDGGLALPLSEMRGYSYLRFKHKQQIVRKREYHRYFYPGSTWTFYVYSERRKKRRRSHGEYVYTMHNERYRPEVPYEDSRTPGTYGPSRVTFVGAVTRDADWIG